jgi:hypothetical protein
MTSTLWGDLIQMIEMGTRSVWLPATDDRTRLAYRKEMLSTLVSLTAVGRRFDRALNATAAGELNRAGAPLPRGMLIRAEVKEHMDGPDGKYLLLGPLDAARPLAVRADDLLQLGSKAAGDRRDPADGSWVMLCGMLISSFDDGKHQGLFLLPLEWMPVAKPAAPDPAADAFPWKGGPPPRP